MATFPIAERFAAHIALDVADAYGDYDHAVGPVRLFNRDDDGLIRHRAQFDDAWQAWEWRFWAEVVGHLSKFDRHLDRLTGRFAKPDIARLLSRR